MEVLKVTQTLAKLQLELVSKQGDIACQTEWDSLSAVRGRVKQQLTQLGTEVDLLLLSSQQAWQVRKCEDQIWLSRPIMWHLQVWCSVNKLQARSNTIAELLICNKASIMDEIMLRFNGIELRGSVCICSHLKLCNLPSPSTSCLATG